MRPEIRALVIDDELPARSELAFLLDDIEGISVVGEAGNVRDAIILIKSKPADVIFLDVNMPGVTGIQLAEGLKTHPRPPAVVFVTAHSHYAVKAFELNALDYLVKPVEVDRLRRAIDKVRDHRHSLDRKTQAVIGQSTTEELPDSPTAIVSDEKSRIMVSKGGKKLFVPVRDICFIMARDDYSYLYTAQDRYLSTLSLVKLEAQLTDTSIFRVHRRYLVNLNCIISVNPIKGGTLTLTIQGSEDPIPVSRRRAPALKTALEL